MLYTPFHPNVVTAYLGSLYFLHTSFTLSLLSTPRSVSARTRPEKQPTNQPVTNNNNKQSNQRTMSTLVIPARKMQIAHMETPNPQTHIPPSTPYQPSIPLQAVPFWRFIPHPGHSNHQHHHRHQHGPPMIPGPSEHKEDDVAELISVWWLDISARFEHVPVGRYKIQWKMYLDPEKELAQTVAVKGLEFLGAVGGGLHDGAAAARGGDGGEEVESGSSAIAFRLGSVKEFYDLCLDPPPSQGRARRPWDLEDGEYALKTTREDEYVIFNPASSGQEEHPSAVKFRTFELPTPVEIVPNGNKDDSVLVQMWNHEKYWPMNFFMQK